MAAWSEADLDTLRGAYLKVATGAQKVRYADGREITYNSPDQVAAAIKIVEAHLKMASRAASGLTRRRFGAFRSGT